MGRGHCEDVRCVTGFDSHLVWISGLAAWVTRNHIQPQEDRLVIVMSVPLDLMVTGGLVYQS